MSDRMFASIKIGGTVTAEQFERVKEIIEEDLPDEPDPDTHLLMYEEEEVSWGQFTELEEYLQEQGISYDRHSDGKYEYDAVEVSFRPGMSEPLESVSTQNGEITALAEDVIEYIEKGLSAEALHESSVDSGIRLVFLRREQPLPPFRIE